MSRKVVPPLLYPALPSSQDCSVAQNVTSTGGGQWVSVLLYEAADGASLI